MRFRNTIHLLVENFKNVYKILLYKLIIGLVTGALLCALVLPEIVEIGGSTAWKNLSDGISKFFVALIPGNGGGFETAKDALLDTYLPQFGTYLLTRMGEIVWISIGGLFIYLLSRFAEIVCAFALGDTLDDRMQTYGEMTFSSSLVKNFGRASKYALIYVPFSFAFDLAMMALCYLCLSVFNIVFGLFFAVIVIAVVQALKLSIACFWMPAMTADKKPLKAATKMWKHHGKGQFWKTFSVYLILIYLIIAVNVLAVICTFASALIITIPMSIAVLICFQ